MEVPLASNRRESTHEHRIPVPRGFRVHQLHHQQVTVHHCGQVVLTEAVVELLGHGVEQVQVGYNAKTAAVGIRPANGGGRGVLRLRKRPNGHSRLLDAKRFFALHRLAGGAVRRLPDEDFGGGIIGFVVDGAKGSEEQVAPKATEKAPKSRKSAA